MLVEFVCQYSACAKSFSVSAYRAAHENVRFHSKACYSAAMLLRTEARFWAKVSVCIHGVDCPYCCHEWTASRNPHGYGNFGVKENGDWKTRLSPRLAWEFTNKRPVPPGMDTLHHCDNPPCVNLWHIYPGTAAENSQDAKRRGRLAKGEQRSHLREKDIAQMYALYCQGSTLRELSARFGIIESAICSIFHHKTWGHLPIMATPEELAVVADSHRPRGSIHWKAKLGEEQVIEIRRLRKAGRKVSTLAREFGVSLTQVKYILNRKSWKHLK